ncbi:MULTISPECIES: ECF transporter S component [Herbiconiux]|uniref:Energy-coupling factor transport system substrate-specific component n=1 Tax=Herbiconiux flava TaxID=881268 RepID=A0A852SPK2_9MICO|nr:ECF transporter S component [Herbiconiux flava]NYD70749.1 energy-coupling factor transport system substrate-specific component [Herbiconiux flava]GLK17508.1 ABC transporter permease [Herbiconiux flava]
MHSTISKPAAAAATRPRPTLKWRVVDIVIASVIGVAAGLIFWVWNLTYSPFSAGLEAVLPGLQSAIGGVWLFAGVLGGLIIRKPGAAIYTELVAATVSALVGTQWGVLTLEAGLVQGLGAELVFALFLYGNYRVYVAVLAGAGAGLAMGINDIVLWYPALGGDFKTIYVIAAVVGASIVAGLLSWLIVRALASTGALNRFAAGREVTAREASARA